MSNKDFHWVSFDFSASDPPKFKVEKNADYVIFGTDKECYNTYPEYIEGLSEKANQHSAYLRTKVHYICGNGFELNTAGLTVGAASVMINRLKKINEGKEHFTDIATKFIADVERHGGGYLEIDWFRNGMGFDLNYIPFKCLRISKDRKGWFFSKDWTLSKSKQVDGNEETGFRFVENFDASKRKGKQIYSFFKSKIDYYPKPVYLAGVKIAEIEAEIATFHLSAIKSGFNIGTIISFFGKPTPKEQEELEGSLKDKFQGADKAGSLLLLFNRDKDFAPVITRISPDELDKRFEGLNPYIEKNLAIAHTTPPILANIKAENQLGARSEIDLMYELYKNTYVKPRQLVYETVFNDLFSYVDMEGRIQLKEVRPIKPFDFKDIMQLIDKDTILEMAGIEEKKKVEFSPQEQQKLKSEKKEAEILFEFSNCGEDIEFFNIESTEDVTAEYWQKFESELPESHKNVLALLNKDPLITDEAIGQALKLKGSEVSKIISSLENDGYIDSSEKNQQGVKIRKVKVSSDGKAEAKDADAWGKEVRYSYDWRSEIPTSQRDTAKHPSRDFCVKMMELSKKKLFSRADIDAISSKTGENVWEFRGGWWNDDGVNKPACRHIWKSHLVTRKK